MKETLLKINGLTVRFGGLVALNAFDLEMERGSLIGLIGPNGAGKTTVFNLITGVYVPTEGDILLAGRSVVGRTAHEIARAGIARTFQNIRLFSGLSVYDNLMAAVAHDRAPATLQSVFGFASARTKEREWKKQAEELLEFVGLSSMRDYEATALPYGEQRKLEIARAMMMKPLLLLLDEPAAGMNPTEKDSLSELVRTIVSRGIGVLLIEHDMRFVMNLCTDITVLDHGEIISHGTPEYVQKDQKVIEAYLGAHSSDAPLGFAASEEGEDA